MTTPSSSSARRGLLRATFSMGAITLVSRCLGLLREGVRAHFLGTSVASDAFGIAFQIPNLLRRLVAEGAVSAGIIAGEIVNQVRVMERAIPNATRSS